MNRRGRMPIEEFCCAINKDTGVGCVNKALPGRSLCGIHDTNPVNLIPGYVNRPRAHHLAQFLGGDEFMEIVGDSESIRDFNVDNALFVKRERDLAARLAKNDHPEFRQDMLEALLSFKTHFERSDASEDTLLIQKLENMITFAQEVTNNDESWEKLLGNAERRVKIGTTAMRALAAERNSFTTSNLIQVILKIFTILESEFGPDASAKACDRIEREVIAEYAGVGQEQILETKQIMSGLSENSEPIYETIPTEDSL